MISMNARRIHVRQMLSAQTHPVAISANVPVARVAIPTGKAVPKAKSLSRVPTQTPVRPVKLASQIHTPVMACAFVDKDTNVMQKLDSVRILMSALRVAKKQLAALMRYAKICPAAMNVNAHKASVATPSLCANNANLRSVNANHPTSW